MTILHFSEMSDMHEYLYTFKKVHDVIFTLPNTLNSCVFVQSFVCRTQDCAESHTARLTVSVLNFI